MRFVFLVALSLVACGGAKNPSTPQNVATGSKPPASDSLVAAVRASTAPVASCVDGKATALGTTFEARAAEMKQQEDGLAAAYVEYGECQAVGHERDGWKGKPAAGALWNCVVAATFDMSKVPPSDDRGEDISRVEVGFSLDNQGALLPASLGCM